MNIDKQGFINPSDPQWISVPIWCVFGTKTFPHMICCMCRKVGLQGQVNIYAYSEPKLGHGQFTVLDQPLFEWQSKQTMCKFFGVQNDALMFLKNHTTPIGIK